MQRQNDYMVGQVETCQCLIGLKAMISMLLEDCLVEIVQHHSTICQGKSLKSVFVNLRSNNGDTLDL